MEIKELNNTRMAIAGVLAATLAAPAAWGAVTPVGSPVPVQTLNASVWDSLSTARNAAGTVVVAVTQWSTPTGGDEELHVRAVNATGVQLTPDIVVTTGGNLFFSGVAINDSGAFVVYWAIQEVANPDNYILAQEFSPTGVALSAPVKVVDFGPLDSTMVQDSNIAIAPNGDFVMGWYIDTNQVTYKGSGCPGLFCTEYETFQYSTYARAFGATGIPKTPAVLVNQSPVLTAHFSSSFAPPASAFRVRLAPSVGIDSSGNFDVAYSMPNGTSDNIYINGYAATGLSQYQTLAATVAPKLAIGATSVSMNDAGQAVVAWGQYKGSSKYQHLESLYLQPINAGGSKNGSAIPLSAVTISAPTATGGQAKVNDLRIDAQGNFGVVWNAAIFLNNGTYSDNYYEQDYLAGGKTNGSPVLLEPTSATPVAAAMDAGLRAMVLELTTNATDYGLMAQAFSAP